MTTTRHPGAAGGRTRRRLCLTYWSSEDRTRHYCTRPDPHAGLCACSCGAELDHGAELVDRAPVRGRRR